MKSADTMRRAFDLSAGGSTPRAIAEDLGVSPSSVRRWLARGPAAITPARVLNEDDCPGGCGRRGGAGAGYSYLLGQYLGDGWIGSNWPRGVHRLEIACCADYPGIIAEVEQAIGAVAPLNAVGHRRKPGIALVSSYSKHWPCLFPQHGPGKKHERPIILDVNGQVDVLAGGQPGSSLVANKIPRGYASLRVVRWVSR